MPTANPRTISQRVGAGLAMKAMLTTSKQDADHPAPRCGVATMRTASLTRETKASVSASKDSSETRGKEENAHPNLTVQSPDPVRKGKSVLAVSA